VLNQKAAGRFRAGFICPISERQSSAVPAGASSV
jgi:hypothetical protein